MRTITRGMLAVALAAGAALGAAAAAAQGLPGTAGNRGQLLYGNHCIACHNTQMHWRDKKLATDWASLKAQVRHWQGVAQLNWGEDEIDDVARFLNDSVYRFPHGGRIAGQPTAPR